MQDTIERQIIVKATPEQVYQAITDPKQIVEWFPDNVEGSLEVGERPVFSFGETHKTSLYIEAANPFTYFSYRWVPGGKGALGDVLQQPNTLVEFHIEQQADGTAVTVKESGFAGLPTELAESSFKDNSGGWEFMMSRLEKVMNQQ